jgi:menaquinone-9 beta-reductase
MPEVIVVGGGPAGSTAAKLCAEKGLETLLLEKRQTPRDKVCSGMLMGPLALRLMAQAFGEVPASVLARPGQLRGYTFHVPGLGSATLENDTVLTWRRDLDHWLNQQAAAAGAEVRIGARAIGVRPDGWGFMVLVEEGERRTPMFCDYLIGAEGGKSVTRDFLDPMREIKYAHIYQETYRLQLDLAPDCIHWFYPPESFPATFTAHYKDGLTVIDYAAPLDKLKDFRTVARDYLTAHHGLDPAANPVSEDGCLEPMLLRELLDGSFLPARGNAMLAGDAGGFLLPVSGEGIGAALQCGIAAAEAILEVKGQPQGEAHRGYLRRLAPLADMLESLVPEYRKMREAVKSADANLPQVIAAAYRATLRDI